MVALRKDVVDVLDHDDVTAELKALAGNVKPTRRATPTLDTSSVTIDSAQLEVVADVAMYASDDLVRHAAALQAMPQAGDDCIRVCAETAESLGLAAGTRVALGPDGNQGVAELVVDDRVPAGACLVHAGRAALASSAVYGAAVSLSVAEGDAAA